MQEFCMSQEILLSKCDMYKFINQTILLENKCFKCRKMSIYLLQFDRMINHEKYMKSINTSLPMPISIGLFLTGKNVIGDLNS